jgi:hypothetical protein
LSNQSNLKIKPFNPYKKYNLIPSPITKNYKNKYNCYKLYKNLKLNSKNPSIKNYPSNKTPPIYPPQKSPLPTTVDPYSSHIFIYIPIFHYPKINNT